MRTFLRYFKKVMVAVLVFTGILPATIQAEEGAVVNVHIDVEVATLDHNLATDGTSFEVIGSLIQGLMTLDPDGNAIPGIAESYEVSEDGKVYTFKLREAVWSNDAPVTANDFVFSWQRLANPDTASEYSFILEAAGVLNASEVASGDKALEELGVKALDDKTLQVTLARPVAFFIDLLAFSPLYPLNEEFYNSVGDQYATAPDKILSNGAFVLASYEPAASAFELKKNDKYYDADNVHLGGLKYQVIKDSQQAVLAYQTGQVDVVSLTGEQVELFKADPEFKTVPAGYVWFVAPNNEVAGLENADLRLALALAFDREVIANNVLKDGSNAASYFIPTDLANGPDGKDFRETAGDGPLVTDVAKAQEHFEKAKEALGQDTFTYSLVVEDTESAINVAQSLEAQIEANLPGVDIVLEQMPKKTRLQRMQDGDYELALHRWGPDYRDPTTNLQLLETNSNYNNMNWSNADFDALYEAVTVGDLVDKPEERWAAMIEAENIALSEAAIFPIYQKGSAVLVKSNVKGVDFMTVGTNRIFVRATKD